MRDKPKSGMRAKQRPIRHNDIKEDKKLIEKMVKKSDLKSKY